MMDVLGIRLYYKVAYEKKHRPCDKMSVRSRGKKRV
jgi:hypothetical protein